MDLLVNIFLNKWAEEYNSYVRDYKSMDKQLFYKKYKNIISLYEKDDFIEYDIDEYDLFILFGLYKKVIFTIDWSGEEYSGQVKKSINVMLKNYGIENMKWRKNISKDIINQNVKRGEYLPLLFKEYNKDLEKINCVLAFFDRGDDAYYFFILPLKEYEKIKEHDKVSDTKLYELYLLSNKINTKILIYVKNKFDLKLNEVKDFMKADKILIVAGDKGTIEKKKIEIEEMGGETIIKEIIE
jgi:hypothetical protein